MSPAEFQSILQLVDIASNRWPVGGRNEIDVKAWANKTAKEFGFNNWVHALHAGTEDCEHGGFSGTVDEIPGAGIVWRCTGCGEIFEYIPLVDEI